MFVYTLHEHAPLYKRSVYLDLRVYPGSAFFGVIFWKSVLVFVRLLFVIPQQYQNDNQC